MAFTSDTSTPDRLMLPGIRSSPSSCWTIPSVTSTSLSIMICSIMSGSATSSSSGFIMPRLCDRFPCGSASITSTFFPSLTKPTPRFTVVVVLDTPPFWLHIAITLHIILTLRIFLICYYCFFPIRRYWIHAWQYFGFFWFDLISDTSIISYCLSFSNLLIMCRTSFLVSEIFKNPIFTTSRFAYFIK